MFIKNEDKLAFVDFEDNKVSKILYTLKGYDKVSRLLFQHIY